MEKSEIALNHANCLQSISNIGETVVRNICTNTETFVPWGTVDWLGAACLTGLFCIIAVLFVGLTVMMVRS